MTTDSSRVVWVIGAGSGVGRATAVAAAQAGWRIAVSGRRVGALDETAGLVASDALVLPFDIAAGDAPAAVAAIAERFGRLDAVVVASGTNAKRREWLDHDLAETEAILQTNLVGPLRAVDAALPALTATAGSIVLVSSRSAWRFESSAGLAYGASKVGLTHLVQTLNAHVRGSGVRATNIAPGEIDTELLQHRPTVPNEDARSRMLTADDVARAILFVLDTPPSVRIDEIVLNPAAQS